MTKTIEELAKEKSFEVSEKFEDETETVVNIKDVIELMKFVRKATLIEAAEFAEIAEDVTEDDDYSDNEEPLNEERRRIIIHGGGHIRSEHHVEVHKNSILKLDKNSIEIYEH